MASQAKTWEEIRAGRIVEQQKLLDERRAEMEERKKKGGAAESIGALGKKALLKNSADDGTTDLTTVVDSSVGVPKKGLGPCPKAAEHSGNPPDMSKVPSTVAIPIVPLSAVATAETVVVQPPVIATSPRRLPRRDAGKAKVVDVEQGGEGAMGGSGGTPEGAVEKVGERDGETAVVVDEGDGEGPARKKQRVVQRGQKVQETVEKGESLFITFEQTNNCSDRHSVAILLYFDMQFIWRPTFCH